jgi:hypothetical protein
MIGIIQEEAIENNEALKRVISPSLNFWSDWDRMAEYLS